jgi:hypothetical protein
MTSACLADNPAAATTRRRPVRAKWLVLFLLLAAWPGYAAECRPVAAEKAAATGDFRRGLLWKIETPGSAPSYLFGTIHSGDPRVTILPCPVKEAFDRSASFSMEVIANGPGIVSMAQAMFFSDGHTLKDTLGDALYRETLEAVGASSATLASGIDHMKPWAVLMMLSTPRDQNGLFLDLALQLEATRQGKTTYGLETMGEQIAVFNDMSIADQVVLLRDAVRDHRLTPGILEALTQAYLNRDLEALQALEEENKPADARVHDVMTQRLLTRRNRNMAERMQARLKEGGAFVAVGALHLAGSDGLLQLLTAAGHRVTRVY